MPNRTDTSSIEDTSVCPRIDSKDMDLIPFAAANSLTAPSEPHTAMAFSRGAATADYRASPSRMKLYKVK